jgi:hypothetical protein
VIQGVIQGDAAMPFALQNITGSLAAPRYVTLFFALRRSHLRRLSLTHRARGADSLNLTSTSKASKLGEFVLLSVAFGALIHSLYTALDLKKM